MDLWGGIRLTLVEIPFSLGFAKPSPKHPFGHPSAFGAPGAGGSFGFADPQAGVGYGLIGRYAYVLNRRKNYRGTVGLTAVGMFGKGAGWGIPLASPPPWITVGGIGQKLGVVDGHIAIRDYLSLPTSFDH